MFVCVYVHTARGKQLELLTPNSVDIQYISGRWHALTSRSMWHITYAAAAWVCMSVGLPRFSSWTCITEWLVGMLIDMCLVLVSLSHLNCVVVVVARFVYYLLYRFVAFCRKLPVKCQLLTSSWHSCSLQLNTLSCHLAWQPTNHVLDGGWYARWISFNDPLTMRQCGLLLRLM